jgi:hypothetical protein
MQGLPIPSICGTIAAACIAAPLSIIVNGYPDIRDRISRNTRPA